ncbi:hypothetical protein [Nocardioides mangrovi]|uniref:Uncharacterized protein n=1 Tax=Nocardioides mangrovi TaxID=2874580 RepID=A0ABS7UI07_9ACTN|nr:hypothetical protein [Nocardioides mangrovi]MBZ5740664.1 hypothetical protein [Nocardioides mangrovi]
MTVKLSDTDRLATEDRCRAELGVASRDIDTTIALTPDTKDLVAVWVKSGSKGLVCARGVVDGNVVDSTLNEPGTYSIDTLKEDSLTLLHADHGYVLIGAVIDRYPNSSDTSGVYLMTKAEDGHEESNPVGLIGDYGFMAAVAEPPLGGDGTGITLTVLGPEARADLDLGNADWVAVGR